MPFSNEIMRRVFILFALSIAITACDEKKSESQYVLKEVIDVQGTCAEDHVGQRDSYAGQVVRWQAATGQVLTNGFVFKQGDLAQHARDVVDHPTVYHTPESLSFLEIDIDTNQPKWVIHGVSDRGAEYAGEKDASETHRDRKQRYRPAAVIPRLGARRLHTEHGPLSSADAAIIILLPIVAAAIGMMTFGIEFLIVEHAM
jgi:hypothetical protein